MPLNEAQGYHHSSLTEDQQREAMKAIYGLERQPMTPDPLRSDEIERMRQIIAQHDAKTAQNSMKEFDLNKPPVAPYVYQEFPFLMYHHETRRTKPAINNEMRERMQDEGWSVAPFPSDPPPEIPLTAAEHAEADEINNKLKKRRA
jgi:hypothetical protein